MPLSCDAINSTSTEESQSEINKYRARLAATWRGTHCGGWFACLGYGRVWRARRALRSDRDPLQAGGHRRTYYKSEDSVGLLILFECTVH